MTKRELKDRSKRKACHFGLVPNSSSVSLLSAPSKMPGYSWSLPAHKSCPRANGTICEHCYAADGFYRMENVRHAQNVRFRWTVESMRSPDRARAWCATMIRAIRRTDSEYFRVHDSGDMFSPTYAYCWFRVCQDLPRVKFWVPTRAWQMPSGPLPIVDELMLQLRKLANLPNVTVRPSALNFGDYAPSVSGLHAGSTADCLDVLRVWQCPAHKQGNQCGECRTCWDDKEVRVSYAKH